MTEKEASVIIGNIVIVPDKCYSIAEYQQAKTMAIEALELQIPKKPTIKENKYGTLKYYCPECGKYLGQRGKRDVIIFDKERYCQGDECGKRLDWSVEE